MTLDRVKAHLRVDGDEENDLIQAYIAAAQATIDGPGGWLGRALGKQTIEYRTWLPEPERLRHHPAVPARGRGDGRLGRG